MSAGCRPEGTSPTGSRTATGWTWGRRPLARKIKGYSNGMKQKNRPRAGASAPAEPAHPRRAHVRPRPHLAAGILRAVARRPCRRRDHPSSPPTTSGRWSSSATAWRSCGRASSSRAGGWTSCRSGGPASWRWCSGTARRRSWTCRACRWSRATALGGNSATAGTSTRSSERWRSTTLTTSSWRTRGSRTSSWTTYQQPEEEGGAQ